MRALRMYDMTNLIGLTFAQVGSTLQSPTGSDPGEWPEGDLPEQMGGSRVALPPGAFTFKLPDNLSQLWKDVEIDDTRAFLANGQPNPTKGQKIKRKQLKL